MAPLGYDSKDRKIIVNEVEAGRVRTIFQSYLRLESLNLLMAELRQQGIVTKVRTLKTGLTVGGMPFTRGSLAHLLRNRFYIREVVFKGEILAGEQPAIIDRGPFDAVQARINEQVIAHKVSRTKSEALLSGRIFDDRGNRMTPSHVRKCGVKYRYYLSSALLQGLADRAGCVECLQPRSRCSSQGRSASISSYRILVFDFRTVHAATHPGRASDRDSHRMTLRFAAEGTIVRPRGPWTREISDHLIAQGQQVGAPLDCPLMPRVPAGEPGPSGREGTPRS
jgi:hypothetical protein